jgi:pilus assembly protein CpaD
MASASEPAHAVTCTARHALVLLAAVIVAIPAAGCSQGPRFEAPFTLANPNERHPIVVQQGEALLDLVVSRNSHGLSPDQWGQLYTYLRNYKDRGASGLVIKAPSGSANERAAMRVYEDVRHAMSRARIRPNDVTLESYYAQGDPNAPLRLSYLEYVAQGPDCPDWSENLARDPQNMPWPNMGCAMQRNLAAMVADPQDFISPHPETPRPSERRDVVWGKYVKGDVTGSKWSPGDQPMPERANASEIAPQGAN